MGMSSTTVTGPAWMPMASLDSSGYLAESGTPLEDDEGGLAPWTPPHSGGSTSSGEPKLTAHVLEQKLKYFTESRNNELAPEFLASIVDASLDKEGRRVIIAHLESCLVKPAAQSWRRVHYGLLIAESLMENGSPLVFTDSIPGVDFVLPKQIWFLEQFEHRADWRTENLVRRKAIELREKMVPWLLHNGSQEVALAVPEPIDEAFSTLATWAESSEPAVATNMPSAELLTSEATSNALEVAGCIGGGSSGRPTGNRTTPANKLDDGDVTPDAFFTPTQTPAMGRAKVLAPHLISL